MNIIISRDRSVRLTQQTGSSYNIQDIVFYIAKTLNYSEAQLRLTVNRNRYPFILENTGDIQNYKIYKVIFTQSVSLNAREYDFSVLLDAEEIKIGTFGLNAIHYEMPAARTMMMRSATPATYGMRAAETGGPYGMTDQHEPVDIVDRDILISNNQNVLVAEDNISQCITFRIPQFYDGIDLSTKHLYLDYIEEVLELDPETAAMVSVKKLYNLSLVTYKEVKEITENEGTEDEITTSYLYIAWAVPSEITKTARSVPFAITAMDNVDNLTTDPDTGNVRQYIWQTKPSTLTIQPNLFKRNTTPIAKDEERTMVEQLYNELAIINENIDMVEEDVQEIRDSDIYKIDDTQTDGEVEFDGGGAFEEDN